MIETVISIIGMLAAQADTGVKPKEPHSVCELIRKREQYSGRMVSVRGKVSGGWHGEWLETPQGCDYRLVTNGVVWPNVMFMAYPNNKSPILSDHATFEVDWKSIRALEERVQRREFRPGKDYVIATYEGLFLTFPDLESRVSPGVPGAHRLGFGPDGLGAPAQILIRSVRNAVIVRGPDH